MDINGSNLEPICVNCWNNSGRDEDRIKEFIMQFNQLKDRDISVFSCKQCGKVIFISNADLYMLIKKYEGKV